MKPTFLILMILFFVSCKNNPQEVQQANLQGENLSLDKSILLGSPFKVRISGSFLFILDNKAPNGYFVNIYSYPDLRYIVSAGAHGEGPEELLGAGSLDVDERFLYLFDISKARLFKYALDDLKEEMNSPKEIIQFPNQLIPVLAYAKTSAGFMFLQFSPEGGWFIETNEQGEIMEKKEKMPFYNRNYKALSDPRFIPALWQSYLDFDEREKIAVAATQLGEVLEVYSIKKDTILVSVGKGDLPGLLQIPSGFSIGKVTGFSDVKIADHKIYAVYSGADRKELMEAHQKGLTVPNGGNYLLVYNKEGEMTHRYPLDRFVSSIDIDLKKRLIIAIDPNNEEHPLCTFTLQ